MARFPNDQAPGACDLPRASSAPRHQASASPSTAPPPTRDSAAGELAAALASASPPAAAASASASPAASPTVKSSGLPASCHHGDRGGPLASDFVNISDVTAKPRAATAGRDASRGTFVSLCGRNENNHRNPDNFIVAPGVSNGAHHVHDYVGNLSTDGFSTDQSLAAAGTTCKGGDRSTYFWPVLRGRGKAGPDVAEPGGGQDSNVGVILRPTDVRLEFRGNAKTKVRAMPTFLRVITGDAKAGTNGPANARAAWTCAGFEDRTTVKYPICPKGSRVQRILDFPSCWDGRNTDSPNHRSHIVFPKNDGSCWQRTVAVPQLRMVLSYDVPAGSLISLDSFPEQKHNPLTDHADFTNLMPDALMRLAVDCINAGRSCDAAGPVGAAAGGGHSAAPAPTATREPGGSASRGGAAHSHASPPGMRVGQQATPPAATPPAPVSTAPPTGAQPTPTAGTQPAGATPGTDGSQQTDGREQTPPGPPDDARRQLAEPPLPGLAGVAGAPGDARNGTNPSAQAADQPPATAVAGTSRTLLYTLNGLALAALVVWLVTVRRRRLR
ncbi:DUF1996 domain-containing protein [Planosporangium mesophilum]|nr:DUF1996 domain-containing protein [Planosporangium mesophilum]